MKYTHGKAFNETCRPKGASQKFDSEWDRIFGKKKPSYEKSEKELLRGRVQYKGDQPEPEDESEQKDEIYTKAGKLSAVQQDTTEERDVCVLNMCMCHKCHTLIESVHRHDFVRCACGNVSIDGGVYPWGGWYTRVLGDTKGKNCQFITEYMKPSKNKTNPYYTRAMKRKQKEIFELYPPVKA